MPQPADPAGPAARAATGHPRTFPFNPIEDLAILDSRTADPFGPVYTCARVIDDDILVDVTDTAHGAVSPPRPRAIAASRMMPAALEASSGWLALRLPCTSTSSSSPSARDFERSPERSLARVQRAACRFLMRRDARGPGA